MKTKNIKPTKEYSEEEINKLGIDLLDWLKQKTDNIFIDDFLYIEKFIPPKDIKYLIETSVKFSEIIEQANAIELAKLQKFAAGDRLNSSIVKQILINKHNWL